MSSPELKAVRQIAELFRQSLPHSVDVASLGVVSKAPYKIQCAREALIWRTEEMARNACDALERDDFSAAAILARAITENNALLWKLREILENRHGRSPQEIDDVLMRVLFGTKQWEDFPKPFHVSTCIEAFEKKVPGVKSDYDRLSEFAHPNWAGVAGLYSHTDQEQFNTYFGRALRHADETRTMIANSMLASLKLFQHFYNSLADLIAGYLAELEQIWPDTSNQDALKS
jgi:hypothetical protein